MNAPNMKKFLTEKAPEIDAAIEQSNQTMPPCPKVIINKDNSTLFHENGTRDKEEKAPRVKKNQKEKNKKRNY